MKDKITKALIYESQGLKLKANEIYNEILQEDPQNLSAKEGLKRVSECSYDKKMLELFLSTDEKDIQEFKKWLVGVKYENRTNYKKNN